MQRHRQREKQAPYRKPDMGLDPGTLGSCPEPKADAQPLSHSGIPKYLGFRNKKVNPKQPLLRKTCFLLSSRVSLGLGC